MVLHRFAQLTFPDNFSTKVDMRKVEVAILRPWITTNVNQYVGMEDDIAINMVMAELEREDTPDPRRIQVNCPT